MHYCTAFLGNPLRDELIHQQIKKDFRLTTSSHLAVGEDALDCTECWRILCSQRGHGVTISTYPGSGFARDGASSELEAVEKGQRTGRLLSRPELDDHLARTR